MNNSTYLSSIRHLINQQLSPLVEAIDQGQYPRDFMRALGKLGGFAAVVPQEQGGQGLSLAEQLDVISAVGEQCGATAFSVWCQSVSTWYLHSTSNALAKARFLTDVANGDLLCGTGMSNTVKHLAGIEKMHLNAEQQGDKYIVNGVLPWVSNIGEEHLIIVCAQLAPERYVMFAVQCNADNLSLHDCPAFSGMEGTQTYNVRFNNVVISQDQVLAHPEQFKAYIDTIKPGFILTQAGMGFGVAQASIDTIAQTNKTHAHVNMYLDDQEQELEQELNQLKETAYQLAAQIHQGEALLIDVLRLRAKASELCLRATNSAALHAGARGYLMRHGAQRRSREAMFVAIVTPALKHLRKEIAHLQAEAM